MKKKNLLAIVLVLILSLSIISLAGCKDEPSPSPSDTVDLDEVVTKTAPAIVYPEYSGADTMVVGYSYFSNKFSPFFSKTGYDQDVAAMTQVALLTTDRQGNIIYDGIEGETIAYNGTDYIYTGIADCTVTINEDDTVDYDFVIRDDLFFSDGVHLTIDDVIFSMYVLADPSYDGSSTFYAQPIKGMEEYRTNGLDMSDEAAAYMAQAAAIVEDVVVEETLTYDTMTADQQAIIDWCIDNAMSTNAWSSWAYNYTVDQYKSWGYGDDQSTDDEVYRLVATDEILGGFYEDYASELEAMKAVQLSLEYVEEHPEQNVASIEGIVKTGPYSMRIEMTEFDATAIYQLGISVTPLHYYGSRAAYKYTENKFGFTKGDLTGVKAKTTTPMGAGAYKFVSFDQGIVTFERNGHYYKGCPKVENILFKETADADKLPGVIGTTFDVSDPSWSKTAGQTIRAENSNGELTGNVITTSTVDNLGYGYIGINADTVNVGDDPDSDASKNLRKGLATLIAVYRETAISSYYGDQASVINYPISNTSWAAPQAADEGYALAYSLDVDGDPIYSADMSAQQRYDAALQATIAYLTAAGYTWDAGTSKFTAAPAGASLEYSIIVPGDGQGDHPSFAICTWFADQLESIGLTLDIDDPADSNELWTALEAGTQELWCAAWGATIDPDMYQVYYSTNVIGAGGTDSNHYHIQDSELDELIMAARTSADTSYRKATYKECLEIILEWGVEVPIYQRQNAIIFNNSRVNISTVTPDITTFWGWMNDIEELEMN